MTTKKIDELVVSQLTGQDALDAYIPISGIDAGADELQKINFLTLKTMLLDNRAVVPHEYWRVIFDANNATSFCGLTELQFFKAGSITNAVSMFPGTPLSSGGTPALAFDNGASGSGWNDSGTSGAWVGYHFAIPVGIARVRITAAQFTDQSPKDFRVQYSDDGAAWVDSFAVTGQTNWINGEVRQFVDPNPDYIDAGADGVAEANKRLWAMYDGTANVMRAGNGLHFTKNGTGNYSVVFDVPRADTNYAIIMGGADMGYQFGTIPSLAYSSKTVDGFNLNCFTNQNDSYSDLYLSIEVIDSSNDTLGGFTDAPLDGKVYARKNGRWYQVGGSGTTERTKAAARIDCSNPTAPTIVGGLNVSGITRIAVGVYQITFTTSLDPTTIAFNGGGQWTPASGNDVLIVGIDRNAGVTATSITVTTKTASGATGNGDTLDCDDWFSFEVYDPTVASGGGGGSGLADDAPLDHLSYVRNEADWVRPATTDLSDIDYSTAPTSNQAMLWNPGQGKFEFRDVVTYVAQTYDTWGTAIQNHTMTFENGVPAELVWGNDVVGTTTLDPDAAIGTQQALQFSTGFLGNGANQYFDLTINANTTYTTVTIRSKNNGEGGYDGMAVLLDGVQQFRNSGNQADYSVNTITVTPGDHVLRFQYTSDGSITSGYENNHISQIIFPKRVAADAYYRGDTVRDYNGKPWFCNVDLTHAVPGDGSTDWVPFASPEALADLTDIDFTITPKNGQALVYNTTSHKWEPGSVASGGDSAIDPDAGKVFVAGGTFQYDGVSAPTIMDVEGCSIARIAAGRYQVTFDNAMSNIYYGVICSGHWSGGDQVNSFEAPIVGVDRGYTNSVTTSSFYLISMATDKTPYDARISFAVYRSASALTAVLGGGGGNSAQGVAALANIKQTLKIAEVEHSVLTNNVPNSPKFDYKIDWGGVVALAYHGLIQTSDPNGEPPVRARYTVPAGKKAYLIEGWGGDQNYGNGSFYGHRLFNVTQNVVIASPNPGLDSGNGWHLTQGGNFYTGDADQSGMESAKVIAVAGDTITCQIWNPSGDGHYRANFGAYIIVIVDAATNALMPITSEGLIGSNGGGAVAASDVTLGTMTTARGTAAVTVTNDTHHGAVVSCVASGGHAYGGVFRPIQANEQITIRLTNGSRSGNPSFGLGVRDNSSTAVLWGSTFNNGPYFERTWTTNGGTDWSADGGITTAPYDFWMRLVYTQSTNTLVLSQSNDGVHWTVYSTNSTTITPTEIGIMLRDYGSTAGTTVGGTISYFEDLNGGVSWSRAPGYDPVLSLAKGNQLPDFTNQNGKVLAVNASGTGAEWIGAETVIPDALEVEISPYPVFATGFAEFGAGFAPMRIWKSGRTVHMIGVAVANATTTADQTIFTLPTGWTPMVEINFSGDRAAGVHAQLHVFPDGRFGCANVLSSGDYISFNATWLVAEQFAYLPQIATSQEVLPAYEPLIMVQHTPGASFNSNTIQNAFATPPIAGNTVLIMVGTYSSATVTPPANSTLLVYNVPSPNQLFVVYTVPADGVTSSYPLTVNDSGGTIAYEIAGDVANYSFDIVGNVATPFSAHFNQSIYGNDSLCFWLAEHDSGALISIDPLPNGATLDFNSGAITNHATVIGRLEPDFSGRITGSGAPNTGSFLAKLTLSGARKVGATVGGGGGTASYPDFTGNHGKVLAVNTAETGVEWVANTGGATGSGNGGSFVPSTKVYDNFAPPLASTFPVISGSDLTVVDHDDFGLLITSNVGGGTIDKLGGVWKPKPTGTTWEVVAGLEFGSTNTAYTSFHLAARNSATGNVSSFGITTTADHTNPGDGTLIEGDRWTSTVYSARVTSLTSIGSARDNRYWRMVCDGTTLSFYTSSNTKSWWFLGTETISEYLGAFDQVGFFLNNHTTTVLPAQVTYYRDSDTPARATQLRPTDANIWSVEATGTGASQNITLPVAVSKAAEVLVYSNGLKVPVSSYTVAGTTLTLTTNAVGDKIEVVNSLVYGTPYVGSMTSPFGLKGPPKSGNTAAAYQAMILATPTLCNYWKFDETAGSTTLADSKGTSNGALFNSTMAYVFGQPGRIGSTCGFNPVGSNLAGWTAARQMDGNDFTFEVWIMASRPGPITQSSSVPSTGVAWYAGDYIMGGDVAGVANDLGFCMGGYNGTIVFGTGNPDVNGMGTQPVVDGSWKHIVWTRVQSTGLNTLYVNGVAAGTVTGGTNSLNANASYAIHGFNGFMADFAVYNSVLDNATIMAHYMAGKAH